MDNDNLTADSRTVATSDKVAIVFSKGFHSYTPEEIKAIRGKLGMSQKSFAGLLFVETSTLSKWEQGSRLPSTPAMRLMQFVEVYAEDKANNPNTKIRRAYSQ